MHNKKHPRTFSLISLRKMNRFHTKISVNVAERILIFATQKSSNLRISIGRYRRRNSDIMAVPRSADHWLCDSTQESVQVLQKNTDISRANSDTDNFCWPLDVTVCCCIILTSSWFLNTRFHFHYSIHTVFWGFYLGHFNNFLCTCMYVRIYHY